MKFCQYDSQTTIEGQVKYKMLYNHSLYKDLMTMAMIIGADELFHFDPLTVRDSAFRGEVR